MIYTFGIYDLLKSIILKYEPNAADEFAVLDKVFC